MWLTRDTLMNGAASGHYFENYVVMELLKNFTYSPSKAQLTYYRDSNAKEIDVFVEENGVIICMCEQVVPIDEKNCFIPCNLI